jgi:hypothetical protein
MRKIDRLDRSELNEYIFNMADRAREHDKADRHYLASLASRRCLHAIKVYRERFDDDLAY